VAYPVENCDEIGKYGDFEQVFGLSKIKKHKDIAALRVFEVAN